MNDRKLLELAAKACGYTIHENGKDINGDTWYWCEQISDCWSPLTDDGDALRLAVKLQLCVRMQEKCVYVESNPESLLGQALISELEMNGSDPYAATRRAIVRAAASIVEQM